MKKLTTQFEEVKLVYRNKTKMKDRIDVKSSLQAYEVLKQVWDMDQINLLEEFKILLLDRNLKLMSVASISKGGYSATPVDPRVVFSIALKRRAQSLILAHNHPSGNLNPSAQDISLTNKLISGGKLLDIPVCDHLIINEEDYYSLADEGRMDHEPTNLSL